MKKWGKVVVKSDAALWAEDVFGHSELGDKRLIKRLVKVAAQMTMDAVGSASRAYQCDEAAAEGAYRWFSNDEVKPQSVAVGWFVATAKTIEGLGHILALEVTTSLSYSHASVQASLGDMGVRQPVGSEAFLSNRYCC